MKKETGFTVTQGNNLHINVEPDSKVEADRLFNEISAAGNRILLIFIQNSAS